MRLVVLGNRRSETDCTSKCNCQLQSQLQQIWLATGCYCNECPTKSIIIESGYHCPKSTYIASATPKSNRQIFHAHGLAISSRELLAVNCTPFAHERLLYFFLQEMLRLVARLKVNVHICSLNVRQTFQLHLQLLSNVVCSA